jgi:hypothetical protein
MKKIVIAALVATSFTPVAFVAPAFAEAVRDNDHEKCELNENQKTNGFYCMVDESTAEISRIIGNGKRCQDATVTVTVVEHYNRNGNLQDEKTYTSEPTAADWGSSYPIGDGCNNA